MIAQVSQQVIERETRYRIEVEVADGDLFQVWAVEWELPFYARRERNPDPRLYLGRALEELGRSLQHHHGQRLIRSERWHDY